MQFVARGMMYALLGLVCLLFAGLVYAVGGLLGAAVGALLLILLQALAPQAAQWEGLFKIAGAMLGGGYAVIGLALLWISQAQQSDDPAVRGWADYLDETRRAVRPKR